MTTGDLAQARIVDYREPPHGACKFVLEQFGATPDPWQEEALVAFCDPKVRRISLQACAGPGKTTILAWCAWYFLATQCDYGEHPNGFATSITGDNLKDNLWKECAKWLDRSDYLRRAFTWQTDRLSANGYSATWFLSARNWPKSASPDEQGRTFSGLHGRNVLVLVDESGGIPPTVLRAGEQALPNTRFGKILQAGNPISLEGMLYEAATKLRQQWFILRVTGDPDDPKAWVHSPRVANVAEGEQSAADLNRESIKTYGRDNPWVASFILGEFPATSINALLGVDDVEHAIARLLRPEQYDHVQKRLGVDVARFGDDRTVIWPRQGPQSYAPVVMRTARTTDIAARVAMATTKWGSELALIDDTGHWGHGVLDNLIAGGHNAIGINFAAPALDRRYKNRRAEMWILMADAIKGGASLPPNVPELVAELITPTYTFVNGVFVLEDKDLIKKRLGRSPDLADALALTYALPDVPSGLQRFTGGATTGHAATEYAPT